MTTNIRTGSRAAVPSSGPADRLERGGGWWSLLLTLAMLVAMTEALNTAAWSDGLEIVRLAVLGGALLGFALALTRWGGFFPALYSLLASLAWISTLFSRLLLDALSYRESLRELAQRNIEWVAALINGTASADNLIFVTQLAILGWWIGYLAVWSLVRHQRVLHAAVPAGAALLVNAYYASQNLTPYLIAYLAAVLLLAIRIELARNQVRWQIGRVRYAPDITLDFLRAGVVFSAIVLLLAWAVPSIAGSVTAERLLRPFEEPWQKLEDTWSRMYRSLNYSRSAAQVSAYGKSLTLGGPVSLTDRPIFEAETPERNYWRAAIYDTYTGQGWLNTAPEVMVFERDTPFGEPAFLATTEMTTTVRLLEKGQETIFAPPQPVRVSVPVNADVVLLPGAEKERTISLLRSRVSLGETRPYQVVSAITRAPAQALRKAGVDYPAWVRDRYLQLPDSLPERVKDLALRVTAAYENPYDKAGALEAMLRTYTYNQQIPAPPGSADGVDYFLFDLKEGYCDYYASALAVMLRSVGVPARFAVGYTPGNLLPQREMGDAPDVYRVLERNAHAWPEVYFPGYGWIQFEPTASEPQLVRPAPPPEGPLDAGLTPDQLPGNDMREDMQPDQLRPDELAAPLSRPPLMVWLARYWGLLVGFLALALAAGSGWVLLRRRQAALFGDSQVLARLFDLLGLWAGRFHIPWLASHTPAEHAATFEAALPEAGPMANSLANLFVAQRYGRQQPAAERLSALGRDWQALQPRFWQRWLFGDWPNFRRRNRK